MPSSSCCLVYDATLGPCYIRFAPIQRLGLASLATLGFQGHLSSTLGNEVQVPMPGASLSHAHFNNASFIVISCHCDGSGFSEPREFSQLTIKLDGASPSLPCLLAFSNGLNKTVLLVSGQMVLAILGSFAHSHSLLCGLLANSFHMNSLLFGDTTQCW